MKEVFKKLEVEWQEKELPTVVERDIRPTISPDVLALIGPRRVGKTYLMYLLLKEVLQHASKEETLLIDFEDNRLVGLRVQEADDIFIAHKELSKKELKFLFFDEIQELPYWSKFIRKLHNQQKYKIVITGSSAKLLGKEIATELRGRYKTIFVSPFSFVEFLRIQQFEVTPKIEFSEKKGALLHAFKEYLTFGGYPEIITESDISERRKKVQSYFQTIFYKDIVERHKLSNYNTLENLMNFLLNNFARPFSITSFEKVLKEMNIPVSKKTISLYLKYLEEAFFVYAVEEFSYSTKKRIMRPKKVYIVDNGLITFLSSQFSEDKGRMLENCVLLELKRKEKEVFFFNEKRECDFVVKNNSKIYEAIQVCAELQPHNEKREIQGLEEAMRAFSLQQGLILTYDQEKEISFNKKKIIVKPVWKWLLGW